MFQFQYRNGKNKKVGKNFWVTKRGNKGLQIGAALGISNWAKRLQIGAKRFQIGAGITNWRRSTAKTESAVGGRIGSQAPPLH